MGVRTEEERKINVEDFSIRKETRKCDFVSSLQAYVKKQYLMVNF